MNKKNLGRVKEEGATIGLSKTKNYIEKYEKERRNGKKFEGKLRSELSAIL